MGHFSNDAFEKFTYHFSVFIGERLRLLLETKHLYQKLSILPKEIHAQLREKIIAVSEKEDFDSRVKEFISGQFAITDKQLFHEPGHIPLLCLIISNVKLFCSECVTREAFRPIWFSDITKELLEQNLKQKTLEHLQQSLKQARFKVAFGNTFQVFYLVYQCQEGTP